MPQACAICTLQTPGTYYFPAILKDVRLQCEQCDTPPPGEGNYAHPRCVTQLKKSLASKQQRLGPRNTQFKWSRL